MKWAVLLLPLLVTGCDRIPRERIEAVPPPSDETAKQLMNGAEAAAKDARTRMDREGAVTRSTDNANDQGDTR